MQTLQIVRLAILAAVASLFATPAGASVERRTLSHQGRERTYLIEIPETAGETPLPLVIVLHGGGGDAESARRITGFSEKARAEGFIVIYPNGAGRRFSRRHFTWNAGHCCGYAMRRHVDDVGFIRRLIDIAVARDNADPARVYVTGMSNGAMMAHRVAIRLSTRIAAVAPVAGGLFGDEPPPSAPVAALMINGERDQSLPIEGGPTRGWFASAWDDAPLMPGAFQETFWARANGCEPAPVEQHPGPDLILHSYQCPDGLKVERYVVEDSGHAWPGGEQAGRIGDRPSNSLDATAAIWRFFKARARK